MDQVLDKSWTKTRVFSRRLRRLYHRSDLLMDRKVDYAERMRYNSGENLNSAGLLKGNKSRGMGLQEDKRFHRQKDVASQVGVK
jgi:hypothetical protein